MNASVTDEHVLDEPVIRVLVVDDDPVCCDGLKQILGLFQDLQVVGEASSAEEAYRIGQRLRPDVVVIDADLPMGSCPEAITRLTQVELAERVPSFICLAVYPDQHDAALKAGAVRFLRKDGSRSELVEAVRQAAHGRKRRRLPLQPSCGPEQPEAEQGHNRS